MLELDGSKQFAATPDHRVFLASGASLQMHQVRTGA